MWKLTDLSTVSNVKQQDVSTVWCVRTSKTRKQLYDCIIKVLQHAKSKQMLTARSVTLLVVRVTGNFLVAKSKL